MEKFIKKVHEVFADLEGKNIATKHPPEKIDRVLYMICVDLFNRYYDFNGKNTKIESYLLPFKRSKTMTLSNGYGELPDDFSHFRQAFIMEGANELAEIELIENHYWGNRSKRVLGGPSVDRPICRIEPVENGDIKTIQVLPNNVPTIKLLYYKTVTEPKYAYTKNGNRYEYDDTNSVDIEFPVSLYMDIMSRLLSSFGIVLRESQLIQVGEMLKSQDQIK